MPQYLSEEKILGVPCTALYFSVLKCIALQRKIISAFVFRLCLDSLPMQSLPVINRPGVAWAVLQKPL